MGYWKWRIGYSRVHQNNVQQYGACNRFGYWCIRDTEEILLQLNCSLKIEAQDATKLTYPAEHFDKVIAISSIEHIPENGDTLSVKEFSRVLKSGGKCLITVPYGDYEEKKQTWYYAGFERRYDLENLSKRLLSVSDLEVEELLFLSTPNAGFVHEIAEKVGNIFEVYYKGNYHITNDDLSIGLSLGWIELTEEPKSSFGALICMVKKRLG